MHLYLTFDQWIVAGFFLVMAASVAISIALDLREPPERDYMAERNAILYPDEYCGESGHFIG